MKLKLLAGAALAGMFAAASASAEPANSGLYGAVDLGAHNQYPFSTFTEFSQPANVPGAAPANLHFNANPDFAGFLRLGYKLSPNFRVELEGGYRNGYLSGVVESRPLGRPMFNPLTGTPGAITAFCSTAHTAFCIHPRGSLNSWSLMGNVIYDFLPNTVIDPFVGIGVGGVRLRVNESGREAGIISPAAVPQPFEQVSGTADQFAYQGLAGLSLHLTDQLSADLTYRYLNTPNNLQ